MPAQTVPITNAPQQSFVVTLQVDGKSLILVLAFRFEEMCQYWLMSVSSSAGNLLLANVPLLCGDYPTSNVLAQYSYLQIGSAYVINVSGVNQDSPGVNGFISDFALWWSDSAA